MPEPSPVYPEIARRNGWEGTVIVKALVDIDGSVIETEVVYSEGHEIFQKSAEETFKKAKFKPAMRFGKPIKAWVVRRFDFKLPNKF